LAGGGGAGTANSGELAELAAEQVAGLGQKLT
jgi:hypothetical protein